MDSKKIVLALLVASLFVGSVCAANLNDFKVDDAYDNIAFTSDYYIVYLDSDGDSGITIYKDIKDDIYDVFDDGDVVDYLVHEDGHEYLVADNDMHIAKNADNTANFTDLDHDEHGVVEVVDSGGNHYIVVVWAKDSTNITNADLMSKLLAFNKDNGVAPEAF